MRAATASSPTSCAKPGRRGSSPSSAVSRPPPGKQAQVDFAQFRVEFTDEPGVVRILWLFTIILGHSRWIWGRFCATQDLQTVLRCHIDAFAAMDGAPSELLYDRMKTAVIGEDANGVVQYNASLVALLNHYGAVPRACRPYRAKTKGKIERPYRYVRQDFWLARSFRNLDDLNAQFRRLAHAGRQSEGACDHPPGRRPALRRGETGADRASRHSLQRRADHRAPRQPRRHGLGGRQSLQRARHRQKAGARRAEPSQRGAHLRGRRADRDPSGAGGQEPAPRRSRSPQGAAASRARCAAAGRRRVRPLSFYDAVARRMAREGAAR